jgi:hypothetical protein
VCPKRMTAVTESEDILGTKEGAVVPLITAMEASRVLSDDQWDIVKEKVLLGVRTVNLKPSGPRQASINRVLRNLDCVRGLQGSQWTEVRDVILGYLRAKTHLHHHKCCRCKGKADFDGHTGFRCPSKKK